MYITVLTSLTHLLLTIHRERSVMPKYDYEPITTLFKPTLWSDDVSQIPPIRPWVIGLKVQIQGPFGLVSKDWEAFKSSIDGMSISYN